MNKFTISVPKVILNVYQEFENSITESVFQAELSLRIDQETDEPNESELFYDLEKHITKPKITFHYDLEKHIAEWNEKHIAELDEIFENTINGIREHLINQFDGNQQSVIVSFFLKHKGHFKKYLPEGRKPAIYNQFVAYCYYPDDTPKDFSLSDSEKELSKLVYETYKHNYNKLNEAIEELKQDYSTGEPKAKPEFSLKEIALRYAYEEKAITKENSNEIAKSFGHNTGHKLYQFYNFYSKPANRKAKTKTEKTFENKIELFENVINKLPEQYKQKAIDELKILTTIKENNDY